MIHGHIHQKPRPFRDFSRPPIKKFATAQDFKVQQQYNLMLVDGLYNFFGSGLNFLLKSWENLLNLAEYESKQPMPVHGHFHRH